MMHRCRKFIDVICQGCGRKLKLRILFLIGRLCLSFQYVESPRLLHKIMDGMEEIGFTMEETEACW